MTTKVKRGAIIAMRIPADVRESLRVAAEKDGRSMSSYAVRVLAQHLKGLESAV